MADYRAIAAVSEAVIALLQARYQEAPQFFNNELEFKVYLAKDFLAPPEFGRQITRLWRSGIMKPLPKWGMMLITTASMTLYIGLPIWGWGGWSAYMAHPARAGAVVALVVLSAVAMFTSGNISSGRREDTTNRWIFVPFLILGFLLGWLPAYTDRREIGTVDGDAVPGWQGSASMETTMATDLSVPALRRDPWNKSRLIGQKRR